jgi:hypothetical protein
LYFGQFFRRNFERLARIVHGYLACDEKIDGAVALMDDLFGKDEGFEVDVHAKLFHDLTLDALFNALPRVDLTAGQVPDVGIAVIPRHQNLPVFCDDGFGGDFSEEVGCLVHGFNDEGNGEEKEEGWTVAEVATEQYYGGMNESAEKQKSLAWLKHAQPIVTLIRDSVATFAVAAFLFGFLIVNARLMGLGLWDFSFLRVEYISAGTLFLIFISCTIVFPLFAWNESNKLKQKASVAGTKWYARFGYWIVRMIITALSLLPSLFFLYTVVWMEDQSLKWAIIVLFTIVSYLFLSPIKNAIRLYWDNYQARQEEVGGFRKSILRHLQPYLTTFGTLSIFILATVFGILVYPEIPHLLGGGMPVFVQIDFAPNSFSATSTSARLIYQDSNAIVFNTNSSTYSVRPDEINSIEFLESDPGFRNLDLFPYAHIVQRQ